ASELVQEGSSNSSNNNNNKSTASKSTSKPSNNNTRNSSSANKNNSSRSNSNSGSINRNLGVGLRLGDPAGLTVKKYMGNNSAWEFNLGSSYRWGYDYDRRFYEYDDYNDRDRYRFLDYRKG